MGNRRDVIVVGAGAGGMIAAAHAAELGANVLLLEKTGRPGQKILITGNGRCNYTNIRERDSFIMQFGNNGRFLHGAFSRFFRDELISLFRRYGIESKTEPNGKIYPVTDNAKDIVKLFQSYLADNAVEVITDVDVQGIITEDGVVKGVRSESGVFSADTVILATGGSSHPQTGSTGDGYTIAADIGHKIVCLRPGLVPLVVTDKKRAAKMMGASLRNVRITAFQCAAEDIDLDLEPKKDTGRGIAGKKPKPPVIESRTGDAIITHFGLSGPVVLEMSVAIVDALENGSVSVSIDLSAGRTEDELRRSLQNEFDIHSKRTYQNIIKKFLQHKLIEPYIEMAGVSAGTPGSQINADNRDRLVKLLKSLRFDIKEPYSMSTAMVTAGGVSLKEIDPRTMESKLVKGLYFCGEVMDLDAGTGGYNLQAAFSTGWVAAESAVEAIQRK